MNRKYSALIAMAMTFGLATALPAQELTVQEEQARLATLWNLNKNDALSVAQFVEKDASIASVIDRDIALLEKDSDKALIQKASAEGFVSNRMIPGVFKLIAVGSGCAAVIGTISSIAGACVGYNVWNTPGSNIDDKLFSWFLDFAPASRLEKLEAKGRYLTEGSSNKDYNQFALTAGSAAPFVAFASLILAGISKYTSGKNRTYRANNAAYIQAMQEQSDRDQAIIAKLKQIKYDNGL